MVSLGGGAVASERVREALARHTVVLLDVDADTAWQRCRNGRPLARDRDRFDALHAERAPLYAGLADAILPADRRDEVRQALPAIRALAEAPAGTKLLWAGDYPVFVGEGLLGSGMWPASPVAASSSPTRRSATATRTSSPPVEAEVRLEPGRAPQDARERRPRAARARAARGWTTTTTWSRSAAAWSATSRASARRSTSAACRSSTCRPRSSPQVDSAYGGKTGVDLPEGKNYAGAYHQPAAVLADPGTLATLPPEELAAGWAEVIKTGLIAGGELWRRVRGREALRPTATSCSRARA